MTDASTQGPRNPSDFGLGLNRTTVPEERLLKVNWVARAVPPFPPVLDFMQNITPGLDDNDIFGICGPTSCDNHERITTFFEDGTQFNAQLEEVFQLYRDAGNPNFVPDPSNPVEDNGVEMPALLKALRDKGLGGRKIAAYGKLQDTSFESLCAAISVFGAVLLAVDLQQAQQGQTRPMGLWDYVAGSPDWGGHAIVAAKYNAPSGHLGCFTWAMNVGMTRNFLSHRLYEAWVPIWPSILRSNKFNKEIDTTELAQEFASLTGSVLPLPAEPPEPAPPDGPPITPTPGPDDPQEQSFRLSDRVMAHINHAAHLRSQDVSEWLEHHLRVYFVIT